jgi:hypothetical protein
VNSATKAELLVPEASAIVQGILGACTFAQVLVDPQLNGAEIGDPLPKANGSINHSI